MKRSGQSETQNCSFTKNQLCFTLEELNIINEELYDIGSDFLYHCKHLVDSGSFSANLIFKIKTSTTYKVFPVFRKLDIKNWKH